jgi:nitroimidazol reductase NimA-like FMN-containing flavoprotein (pyridoxamine 5'-phosphate oxidase superfamily)
MEVQAAQLRLPDAYGHPTTVQRWEDVEPVLQAAGQYWLATTRPDGRPHTVPIDGVWSFGALWFGGHPSTVHLRNLRAEPRSVVHIASTESPVIVEGTADWLVPPAEEAVRLAEASRAKYGYAPPNGYRRGVWRLRPDVVLSWTVLFEDATRFSFSRET